MKQCEQPLDYTLHFSSLFPIDGEADTDDAAEQALITRLAGLDHAADRC